MSDAQNWIEEEFEYFVEGGAPDSIGSQSGPDASSWEPGQEGEEGEVRGMGLLNIITDLSELRKYWAEILTCLVLSALTWIWGLPFLEYYLRLGKRFIYLLSFAIPILAVWGFGKVNKKRMAQKYYKNRFAEANTGSGRNVSGYTKKTVAAEQQWHCAICGSLLDASYEIDHILPLYKGGTNAIENLQALCPNCHRRKTIQDSIVPN